MSTKSSNHPVNADARARVVPCTGFRARAGYWERWANMPSSLANCEYTTKGSANEASS